MYLADYVCELLEDVKAWLEVADLERVKEHENARRLHDAIESRPDAVHHRPSPSSADGASKQLATDRL